MDIINNKKSLEKAMKSIPFIETPKTNTITSQPSISETSDLTQELRGLVNNISNEETVERIITDMSNGIDVFHEDNDNIYQKRTMGMINSKVLLSLAFLLIIILIIVYIVIEKNI